MKIVLNVSDRDPLQNFCLNTALMHDSYIIFHTGYHLWSLQIKKWI